MIGEPPSKKSHEPSGWLRNAVLAGWLLLLPAVVIWTAIWSRSIFGWEYPYDLLTSFFPRQALLFLIAGLPIVSLFEAYLLLRVYRLPQGTMRALVVRLLIVSVALSAMNIFSFLRGG